MQKTWLLFQCTLFVSSPASPLPTVHMVVSIDLVHKQHLCFHAGVNNLIAQTTPCKSKRRAASQASFWIDSYSQGSTSKGNHSARPWRMWNVNICLIFVFAYKLGHLLLTSKVPSYCGCPFSLLPLPTPKFKCHITWNQKPGVFLKFNLNLIW